mmetsp:Transcript_76065/g.246132  ORF Transcript_76065/g.246132 Transcript_76065/m.246132 type:complete len:266 (+) Transcript_76065:1465-2262(+)
MHSANAADQTLAEAASLSDKTPSSPASAMAKRRSRGRLPEDVAPNTWFRRAIDMNNVVQREAASRTSDKATNLITKASTPMAAPHNNLTSCKATSAATRNRPPRCMPFARRERATCSLSIASGIATRRQPSALQQASAGRSSQSTQLLACQGRLANASRDPSASGWLRRPSSVTPPLIKRRQLMPLSDGRARMDAPCTTREASKPTSRAAKSASRQILPPALRFVRALNAVPNVVSASAAERALTTAAPLQRRRKTRFRTTCPTT